MARRAGEHDGLRSAVLAGVPTAPFHAAVETLRWIFVPGLTQLLVVHAVRAAGASRAGILFGMAPLFSVLFAILAFGEPLRWPLAVGTLLVVAGGIALAAEGERPVDYRAYGAALAVSVAVAFGLRDNVARATF
jgi:drug/metabolite transporter (DMT)-like permease